MSAFGPAKLRLGWHAIHKVTFDDVDKDTLDIACFVRAHSNFNGFMVNCSQGISRAQGVAAWVSEHFNIPQFALIDKDSEFALDPKFNQHVYKMLKKHDRNVS
jgi:hypothetical protein